MENDGNVTELYRRYRPKRFKDVLGQEGAVAVLEEFLKKNRVPRTLLFTGGSGTGKTTLARILKNKLGCGKADFKEINAAESRGIDTIRDIERVINLAPIQGSCRIWIIDECHALTREAQSAALKLLEDTPGHVYFMLCTTDPDKLLPTILSRCTRINLKTLDDAHLLALVQATVMQEKTTLTKEVLERIVDEARGSARTAMVLLHKVIDLPGQEEQLNALQPEDIRKKAFDLVKALLWQKTTWVDVAKIISDITEDPEGLRRLILTNAMNTLLKGKNPRAAAVLSAFRDPFYDTGKPGLVLACWDVLQGR